MNNLFDKIAHQYKSELPFVAYRKPNEIKLSAFLMPDNELNFVSNFKEKGFVFAPFNIEEKTILFSEEKALFLTENVSIDSFKLKEKLKK